MFALDLFNTRYERDLREGAVDDLEGRRIDDLNAKMDDLIARAREAKTPEHKAGLKREFDKVKDERDSYFKIKEELSGDELNQRMAQLGKDASAGITQSMNRQSDARIAALRNPPKPKSFMQQVGDKQIGMVKGAWKGLTSETGIPGNVPTEKIPGKEDLLKGRGRTYYEDQKKNSKEIDEHGGGIGPKQHWQDLMQENKLSVGDPIIVTAPNEFEGKTGEIHELSPSGTFVIVDLYNHGKHSMHLSDVEYNQYADDENNDDWYDEGVAEGWYDPKSFPGAKIGPHIAGPVPTPVPQVKDQIIKLLIASHKDLIDQYGQRDVNIVAQSEAVKAEPTPQGIRKAVNNVINFLTSGLSVNRLRQQTLEDTVDEGWSDAMVSQRTGQPRTPYSVYIKGKKWKDFENDDHAEAVANKLRAKFNAEGRDPSVITIAPTYMSEEQTPAGWGEFPPKQEITIIPPKKLKSGETYQDQNKYWQSQGQAPIYKTNEAEGRVDPILIKALNNMPDGLATHREVLDAAYDAYTMEVGKIHIKQDYGVTNAYIPQLLNLYKEKHGLTFNEAKADPTGSWVVYNGNKVKRFKSHTGAKSYAEKSGGKVASSEFYADKIQGVKEAQTDYQKRRQRERDVDAGKPVTRQPKNPQTDYARKRAKDRKDMELGEGLMKEPANRKEYLDQRDKLFRMMAVESNPANKQIIKQAIKELETRFGSTTNIREESSTASEAVERAILNRIMVAHTDLLMKFGPEKVMQAAEEVAYNVGDVDEIGTSDVSAYVHQVKQILGVPEEVNEKWSQKYKSSINCANPKGFSQKAHCAGKKK